MIEMNLVGVRVELPTNQPIVLLREREGERFLPIWIGAMEATAIAFALQGIVTARPMTHDLLKNVLEDLSVQERTDLHGARTARLECGHQVREGQAGVDDVLDDDDVLTADIFVKVLDDPHNAGCF